MFCCSCGNPVVVQDEPMFEILRVVPDDKYGRTRLMKTWDEWAGVAEYQLEQRYGRIVHEVVPPEIKRDWVDDLADSLDALLGTKSI